MGGERGVILCRICSIVAENWVRDIEGKGAGCRREGGEQSVSIIMNAFGSMSGFGLALRSASTS